MRSLVCLYRESLAIHHFQDFNERETLPIDLPHKNLIWRTVVRIHPSYNTITERLEGETVEVTDTECIMTSLVVPRIPETEEEKDGRALRAIQYACFTTERLPLSMLVFELFNEVRVLKGQEPLMIDAFKKELQRYAA